MTGSRDATIVVFAKLPRAGDVKTRLTPALTPEQAANLYAAMLADVLATTASAAAELALAPVLALHPLPRRGELADRVPAAFRMVAQRGADLAARMDAAVREAAAAGSRRILLRGSDNPTLDRDAIGAALGALGEHPLVLQPDDDGGYGLVGLRTHVPGLFDHPMSDAAVLTATLERATRNGLRAHLLEPGFDVDRPEDLRRLAGVGRPRLATVCPRTLAYLDEHELWPQAPPQRAPHPQATR